MPLGEACACMMRTCVTFGPATQKRGTLAAHLLPFCPWPPGACVQASLLQYAQGIAEAQSGAAVPDAVVAVPPFFGQAQRQALQDAAQLAGVQGFRKRLKGSAAISELDASISNCSFTSYLMGKRRVLIHQRRL